MLGFLTIRYKNTVYFSDQLILYEIINLQDLKNFLSESHLLQQFFIYCFLYNKYSCANAKVKIQNL